MATFYAVTVSGCDDETQVDVDLTAAEADTLARVAALLSSASSYSCQPTMTVMKLGPKDDATSL